MKKFLALLLSLVMVLALVACGDKKDDTNTDDQDNNEVTDFKVGFIMLHDENSTYDLNFINAAKEACETLGSGRNTLNSNDFKIPAFLSGLV